VGFSNAASAASTSSGERALAMLQEAGFGSVEVHQLEHDFQNDYYVARP
jgi:hypothetical protein